MNPEVLNKEGESPLEGLESFVPGFLQDRKKELNTYLPTDQGDQGSIDLQSLQKIAHQWKGFSEPYGFKTLGLLAAELEQKAKAGDEAECHRILNEIEEYLALKEKHI